MFGPRLVVDVGPEGYLDTFEIDVTKQSLMIRGWSVDRLARRAPAAIVVHLDGEVVCRIEAFESRADVHASQPRVRPERCAFSVQIPVGLLLAGSCQTLVVEAVSARGVRSLLYAGTLPGLHLQVVRLRHGELG